MPKTLLTFLDEESKYPQDSVMDKREVISALKKYYEAKRQYCISLRKTIDAHLFESLEEDIRVFDDLLEELR